MKEKKKASIISGSAGLIGSQSVKFLIDKGYIIFGIDNDMRSYFFGEESSTKENDNALVQSYKDYHPNNIDIRNFEDIKNLFVKVMNDYDLDLIIHTAAQPSHDWAAKEPLTDFTINALGTMNMLEATRLICPKASFIFTSTNKVYGDRPNISYETKRADDTYKEMRIFEESTRYEAYNKDGLLEINETMSIDDSKHSVFGASKVSADVMVQEYGKYFQMNTVCFRGGCLTGPQHAGNELHGFLSYLVKCIVNNKPYTVFGYKMKQVRDNIHSWDLVNMFWSFHQNPKHGEVYNAGGGRENSTSIIEAVNSINEIMYSKNSKWIAWDNYTISAEARSGDHVFYITDLTKFKRDYPEWTGITISLKETLTQMIDSEISKNQ